MTYQDVFTFTNVAAAWLENHKDESKLRYALQRMTKRATKAIEAYRELVEDIGIEHAAVNKDGIIQREANGAYAYTKIELHAVNKEVRELFRSDVELEPYFVKEAPEDLTEAERAAFAGFVLPVVDDATEKVEDAEAKPALQAVSGRKRMAARD